MPVVFANDLLLFLCIQLAFWVVGLPLIYLLPRQQISGRCLAAPIFGCTFLGIATTILYQCGVPSAVSTLMLVAGATVASISILAHVATTRWPPALSSIVRSGGLVGITLVVSFLCILPKWTGGEQFAVFQGNVWDHLHYLSATVAFAHHSYDYLRNVHVHAPEAGYVWHASTMLSTRPTVSILYAGFSNRFQPAVFGGYVYLAALQLNLFFAAAFSFRNLLTADSRVSYALGGALCIGFFTQYVVDINAWSQLAAMPIVLVAFALVVLLLDTQRVPDPLGGRVRFTQCCRLAFATGIPGAGLLYFYPEIIPVYAPVFATAVLARIWPGGHRVTGRHVCSIGAGAILAALLGVLSWEATLHFLWRQMRFGVTADVDWWRYFQRYLLPADLDSCSCSAYALFSAPIDFALGAVGVYFLSPGPGWSLGLRIVWKGLLCIALVWLLAASGMGYVAR
jgi:hypothetical protein